MTSWMLIYLHYSIRIVADIGYLFSHACFINKTVLIYWNKGIKKLPKKLINHM